MFPKLGNITLWGKLKQPKHFLKGWLSEGTKLFSFSSRRNRPNKVGNLYLTHVWGLSQVLFFFEKLILCTQRLRTLLAPLYAALVLTRGAKVLCGHQHSILHYYLIASPEFASGRTWKQQPSGGNRWFGGTYCLALCGWVSIFPYHNNTWHRPVIPSSPLLSSYAWILLLVYSYPL